MDLCSPGGLIVINIEVEEDFLFLLPLLDSWLLYESCIHLYSLLHGAIQVEESGMQL